MEYATFLESKQIQDSPTGLGDVPDLNPQLFDFQAKIVEWALRRGRAALFADCGLGKTPMQLEWAKHIPGKVLIVAPLAVSRQTIREGAKFGVEVVYSRDGAATGKITITNYEMLHRFDATDFAGLVLDESSILKSFSGVYRRDLTAFGKQVPFRLACTATPAPNDLIEVTNHAAFLDVMSGKEIIALFFIQDGNTTHKWKLKGHAREEFWKWMASWSVAMRRPSDLGYDDTKFILPSLHIHENTVHVNKPRPGELFSLEAVTMDERRRARRDSTEERVAKCAEIINGTEGPWIVWCNLNYESKRATDAIDGAVEVKGADSIEHKETALLDFSAGKIRCLVTKPTIAGHGMNWQNCADMVFLGLSDSYEQFYQAVRRCWRFGQTKPVNAHVVVAHTEGRVRANIIRKEQQAADMMENIVSHMEGLQMDGQKRETMTYQERDESGEGWRMMLGDACERIKEIPDASIGLSVFSPPFPGMYAYTNSPRDVGNTKDIGEMIKHFEYLFGELQRVTMPGRLCCIHLMQLTAMKSREGYIGLKDYRGAVIQGMMGGGWRYAGEVTIDKNPQVQATRNKDRGLLFKSLAKDSSMMRMALADYLVYFRKDGENPVPIHAGISKRYDNPNGWITEEEWIEWAAPVWYRRIDKTHEGKRGTTNYPARMQATDGIQETDVLATRPAKDDDDEKHLCPLQLGVIERCVKLWSAPGDTVFSPFAGIGSEGHVALQFGREFVGIELKETYWRAACDALVRAEQEKWGLFQDTTI